MICGYRNLDGSRCTEVLPCLTHGVLQCDCGNPAASACCSSGTITGLVPCAKPICGFEELGGWCSEHRHAAGTMGYPLKMEQRADFKKFVVDLDGSWWDPLVTFLWNLRAHAWKAQKNLDRLNAVFPPPAPLPKLVLSINGVTWESDEAGKRMVRRG